MYALRIAFPDKVLRYRSTFIISNPFTAQACKISELKDARTRPANSTLSKSYNKSTFSSVHFDAKPFHV